MSTAKIFHAKQPLFEVPTNGNTINMSDYILVAEIGVDDLDDAYSLSQNIDAPWALNEKVKAFTSTKIRSTSVGDVVEINGQKFICDMLGWKRVFVTKI